jgi:hypothetical protein
MAEKVIQIPAPNIQMLKVAIHGTNPLIFNRWTEKAKQMIWRKQQKDPKANTREKRDMEKEGEATYYKNADGKVAFPALSLKQAMVGACRSLSGVHMTVIRGAVFIVGDADGLIPVKYKKKQIREDMVRLPNGSADIRFRGEVSDWSMELIIKYNADVLSSEQVMNLLQIAGFSCGIGEWRPEKNGDYGTFEISTK